MNPFFNFLIRILALVGSGFIFHKIGYELGLYLMDRNYSLNKVAVLTLPDADELISHWEWSDKTEPLIIIKQERWKDFQ